MSSEILFEIFIFLIASCLVVPLVSRFKLSSVIGYLFAGLLIGPACLGLITDPEKVVHLAEFGIIMMLFVIGLELEPASLWRLRKSIVGLGGLQVILTTIVFTIIGLLLHLNLQTSLAIAMALALSSTALVLNLLQEKNLLNSQVGEASFSTLLFQDIAVIPILILMPLLSQVSVKKDSASNNLITNFSGLDQALIIGAVILMVIIIGRYFLRHLFRLVAKSNMRELFTALSLALVVGVTLLMNLIGISPALGAFVAGVVLANSEYRRSLETDIQPFKGLLLGLFFISIGMGMDFNFMLTQPLQIFAAVICLIVIKALILFTLGKAFKISTFDSIFYAVILAQGGEFAFVLFQFAQSLMILDAQKVKFLTLVVAISIAATPVILHWVSLLLDRYYKATFKEIPFDAIDQKNAIILSGFGRFGQVIGRFLTGQGVAVTVLENNPDQIELLRKFGFKAYFGDSTRLDFLKSAHADKAKLLIITVDDVEASLKIASLAKEEFPNLTIFARARNRQHAYDLHKLGVFYFKRELFDSSLDMAKEIMLWLGKDKSEIELKAQQFRDHDEKTLQQSFKFFEDKPALVNFSKTRSAELEKILQSDNS
ncbi:MAG: potassium transporter [Proteobacteria bacterium]|nr:potassium transporter [Pseudomonadota bacterium]